MRAPRERYTEEEFAGLNQQVDSAIAEHGITWTTNDLRRAIAERRRVRWGVLNGIALLRHLDALADGHKRCHAEADYCYVCDEHPSHGHAKTCPFFGGV